MNYDLLDQATAAIRARWPEAKPSAGIILGSGWTDVVEGFTIRDTMPYEEIPGLGTPGIAGHAGRLAWAEASGVETLIFQGRRHWYEGEGWTPIALPVYALIKMGISYLVLTNAAGAIRGDLNPGDLMGISDHINNMPANPLVGEHHPIWGPRFPDQTAVYDPYLRTLTNNAGLLLEDHYTEGIYLASSGPTYETPAEVRTFQRWGADAVGMSTVPEAILASSAGIRVAGISCITNLASGIGDTPLSHEEVTDATQEAMPRMKIVLLKLWEELADAEIS